MQDIQSFLSEMISYNLFVNNFLHINNLIDFLWTLRTLNLFIAYIFGNYMEYYAIVDISVICLAISVI